MPELTDLFEVPAKILASKIEQHNKWLKDGSDPDAYKAIMNQALIQNYDFTGVDLTDSEFRKCKFVNCNFSKAQTDRISFVKCILEDCNFGGSNAGMADFKESSLIRCNFLGDEKVHLQFVSSTFEDCDFSNTKYYGAKFTECYLGGHDFSGSNLTGAIFTKCNLDDANFTDAMLREANFMYASCKGTNFTNANLITAVFTRAKLHGANLTNIKVDAIAGNNFEIKSAHIGGRHVTYTSGYVWIDCIQAPIKPFLEFKPSNMGPLEKVVENNVKYNETAQSSGYTIDTLSVDTMEWVENYIPIAIKLIKASPAEETTH